MVFCNKNMRNFLKILFIDLGGSLVILVKNLAVSSMLDSLLGNHLNNLSSMECESNGGFAVTQQHCAFSRRDFLTRC